MIRTLSAALLLLLAAPLSATPSPEEASLAASESFRSIDDFHPRMSQSVRISGDLRLTGTAHVPRMPGYVSLTLSGWADLRDATGKVRGSTHVSYHANFFVSNGWVSEWVRPDAYVTLYQDGRAVGSTRVEGSFRVSGHVSGGGWVDISGSGPLYGNVAVQQP